MITYFKGAVTLASNSELPVDSYNPPNISFHIAGHLQRWQNSAFSNQDPHLWTAFLITFVVCCFFFGFKYIQKRRKVNAQEKVSSLWDDIGTTLIAKQKRLEAKIIELEKKYSTGNVSKNEYKQLFKQYVQELSVVKVQIQEIEEIIGKKVLSQMDRKGE